MKNPHRRIARWFNLLAEYDFAICYPAGRDNPSAEFLSWPVKLIFIENKSFEANLNDIAHYSDKISVPNEPISISPELKKKSKDFLVQDESLFRRT